MSDVSGTLLSAAIIVASLTLGGAVVSMDVPESSQVSEGVEKCEEDLKEMREESSGRTICTMQIADMQCPYSEEFSFKASNGCEISALSDKDWTRTR